MRRVVCLVLVMTGLLAITAGLVVSRRFAEKYLSSDHQLTDLGMANLQRYKSLSLVLGVTLLTIGGASQVADWVFPIDSGDRTPRAIVLLLIAGFITWATLFIFRSSVLAVDGKWYFCLVDDAMISMRYAWNFSHGSGLTWNPGVFVEGYTNLLMTLVMSAATLMLDKSAAVLSIQIFGLAVMVASAYVVMQIADQLAHNQTRQRRWWVKVLAFLCAVAYYPLVYWALLGMETGLLALLLLSSVWRVLGYTREMNLRELLLTASLLGLAFLTRPDSALFALVIFAFAFLQAYQQKSLATALRHLLLAIALYSLFVLGQTAFRWLYYGELVPNTYVLKVTGMPLLNRLQNGLAFIGPFLLQTAALLVVVVAYALFTYQHEELFLMSFTFVAIAYQIWNGGDPWDYWRIMGPTMPLTFLVFIRAVFAIGDSLAQSNRSDDLPLLRLVARTQHGGAIRVTIVVLVVLVATNGDFLPEMFFLEDPAAFGGSIRQVNTAIAINRLTTDQATVGVTWAGHVPYYTGRYAIDFLGKSDKYVASLPPDRTVTWNRMRWVPGHNKYDLAYSIKELKPTYVQTFQWGTEDLTEWAEEHYVQVDYEGYTLSLRKGSPHVYWERVETHLD